MALHPEGIFTSGPLALLAGLAATGPDPLEWEVLRLKRVTRTEHWDAPWRRTPQPLASQLDYLSVTFTDAFFATCPADTRRSWTAAAGTRSVPEFMTDLAMLLRMADRQGEPGYDEVPLAPWEARARFPLLFGMDTWAYDDEFASFEESLRGFIANEHPYCYEELAPRLAQALEARALCARSEAFAASLRSYAPEATPQALDTLARVTFAHLEEQHG